MRLLNKMEEIQIYKDYQKHISMVLIDYNNNQKKLSNKYKFFSTIRAITIICIPLVLVIEKHDNIFIAILSAIGSFSEFYIRFNDFERKINVINNTISDLTYELLLYKNNASVYDKRDKENTKLFVERTSKIIRDTDISTYNRYNADILNYLNTDYTKNDS